jgi:hypothetical protein
MLPSSFLLAVLQHTPVWVWFLLATLLALGFRQARPHRIALPRMVLMPLAMLGLSLWGVVSVFGPGQALLAWACGTLAAAAWTLRGEGPRGVRWSAAERSLRMPGSWLPMALILGIFCTKFGVGVGLARHPEWRAASDFALGASLVYGVFSGLFAGRALALLRLARRQSPGAGQA